MSILGRFGSHERLPCPAGEQKEYKEVEKIVHKEVIKEVTVGVSEEELSKVRGRVVEARRHRALPRRSTPRRNEKRRRLGNGPSGN